MGKIFPDPQAAKHFALDGCSRIDPKICRHEVIRALTSIEPLAGG